MGAATHLPMGDEARIRLENESVLPLRLKQIQQNLGLNCAEKISKETKNYLAYLENLFKAYFIVTQRRKEEQKKVKNRYFIDKVDGSTVGDKIEEEWKKIL